MPMDTKSLECAILSLLRNVPVWIFNLPVLAYFTSFAYSTHQHCQTGPRGASLEYWTRTEYSRQFYWSTLHLGQPHLDPPNLDRGFGNKIFAIFTFSCFYIVQQLGNFALIEDSASKVKTMTNRNIIISENQNRKMENMSEKYLPFWVYYLYPLGVVYIHVKSVRWAGSLQPVCHKGHSLYAKALEYSVGLRAPRLEYYRYIAKTAILV